VRERAAVLDGELELIARTAGSARSRVAREEEAAEAGAASAASGQA
jgi:hypothetical protein